MGGGGEPKGQHGFLRPAGRTASDSRLRVEYPFRREGDGVEVRALLGRRLDAVRTPLVRRSNTPASEPDRSGRRASPFDATVCARDDAPSTVRAAASVGPKH